MSLFNPRPSGFFDVIPEGSRADVTYASGKRRVVNGPARVLRLGREIRLFDEQLLKEHESGTLFDEHGKATEKTGPCLVHVHPDGEFVRHRLIQLLPHEAMIVVDKNGKPTIHVGTGYPKSLSADPQMIKGPQVELKPLERLHQFVWTGSKGDTEFKSPGTLRFEKLRLQETQTWFAVEARTKDGVMMRLHLMLFLEFTDVAKLLKNDDPMGVLFNSVNAAILSKMGETGFDDFRKAPAKTVEDAALLAEATGDAGKHLEELGLKITKATLRLWVPTDRTVEQLMAQEASATAQQAVAEAQHKARIKQIENEKAQLIKERDLDVEREKAAVQAGKTEATKTKAYLDGLREDALFKDAPEALGRLLVLKAVADSASNGLTVTQEALFGAAA